MLVTSIFFFYHNVFKRPLLQGRSKLGLCSNKYLLLFLQFFYFFPKDQDKTHGWSHSEFLPNTKILDSSKVTPFCRRQIKMAEINRFFCGMLKNIFGTGENSFTSIFSFFHNFCNHYQNIVFSCNYVYVVICKCFQFGLVQNFVFCLPHNPESQLLMTLKDKPFENIVGKGENACNQHFLLFPQCFLPIRKRSSVFQSHLFGRLQML